MTITKTIGEGFYSEKRSKFLAFAHHVESQAQIREMFGYPDERYSDIETEIKEKLTQECTYTFKNKEGIWFNFGSGGTAADSYLFEIKVSMFNVE